MKAKNRLLMLCASFLISLGVCAQSWTEPRLPSENLESLSSSEIVYFYNVEADAFLINGMDWNTNACATRLVDGDMKASEAQQCHAYVGGGKVRIKLKRFADYFISCLGDDDNNVYVDQNEGQYFTYTETQEGSGIYTLNNDRFGDDLDVSWAYGGHLTTVEGDGRTKWAFIKEENITNGTYMAYKARKALYGMYKAVVDAGKADVYAGRLADAYEVYASSEATPAEIEEASRELFDAVYADVAGPIDVSFLFDDADMVGNGAASAWTNGGSTFGWGAFENYHNAFSLTQTQIVPQGVYDVSLHAYYREDGTGTPPVLMAEGKTTVSAFVPDMLGLDFEMVNANGNNWTQGGKNFVPGGLQSAGQAITHNGAVTVVEGAVVGADGRLTISAEIKSAEQWFCWSGFRVTYRGLGDASLKESLAEIIARAEALYGDGTGNNADVLKGFIDSAKSVYADDDAANHVITIAGSDLEKAMTDYKWDNASVDSPIEMTELINNNSFEKGFDGWTYSEMGNQSNTAFSLKHGSAYVEKWTGAGGRVGNASVKQNVKGLKLGMYVLKAVAQNLQENSSAKQRNAWIVANNSRTEVSAANEYTLVFTNIETEAIIGFEAEGATGNWIAVDNFRLYYAGGDLDAFRQELQAYLDNAKVLVGKKMQSSVSDELNKCIAAAEAELAKDNADGFTAVSTPLRKATEMAETSIQAYVDLAAAIAAAEEAYGDGELKGAQKFLGVINDSKAVNESLDSTLEAIAAAIANLEKAAFEYNITNPTGTVPTVVTDKRYARGAIEAFGRMSVSGISASEILEQGFCWSTEPNPTVLDNRTTSYLENNGRMYRMSMEPATVYFMRAYVITKGYAVGYGDVIKMSTLPQGRVTYWYNNGGDAAHNDRINSALTTATTYWSNYTSIRGFNVSCTFSPGTPTADCGYGGNMRIGTNMGQRAGTCMHEMNHGIGGGILDIWGGLSVSPLRETINGYWAGDRANEVVRFWENNDNLIITGAYDNGHWGVVLRGETYSMDNTFHNKYPHNGAHLEPGAWAGPQNWNDTEVFYIGNSLINQGFCEDGLVPVNYYSGGFCLPAYVFEQDDNEKYYIKNESDDRGLVTSYLVEQKSGTVKWVDMGSDEVVANDSAAWYVSFTPDNQYYQFRNAATGRYLTFSANGTNGFKTAVKASPSANEDFHLMKGRKDVEFGDYKTRGYWLIHPEAKSNPATLTALASGAVSANSLDLYNTAEAQRWIFVKADEIPFFELGLKDKALESLDEMITNVRRLKFTKHTEDVPGADAALEDAITAIKALAESATSAGEVNELIEQTRAAGMEFLGKVTPVSMTTPFNITFLVKNAAIDDDSGWSAKPTFASSCCEYYQSSFDFHQTVTGLPAGTYQLRARAFQRPGSYVSVYNSYVNGTDNVNTVLYAGSNSVKICNIAAGARRTRYHSEDVEVTNPKRYIPNTMESGAAYLKLSTYENMVATKLDEAGSSLRIGIKCPTAGADYWTLFDNFRLYYYGTISPETVTSIDKIETDEMLGEDSDVPVEVYNLQGQKVGNSLNGLPRGVYIVNKKKVFVK